MSNIEMVRNLLGSKYVIIELDSNILEANVPLHKNKMFLLVHSRGTDIQTNARSEGDNIPHMHFGYKSNNGFKTLSVIRLDCAKYFDHGGRYKTLNELNMSKFKKIIDAELRNICTKDETCNTNWDYLVAAWYKGYQNDGKCGKIQPDYTKL